MSIYDQRVAERFGYDASIRILCASDPDGDSELRDLYVQAAYDDARLAFHFAARVRYQRLVAPLD